VNGPENYSERQNGSKGTPVTGVGKRVKIDRQGSMDLPLNVNKKNQYLSNRVPRSELVSHWALIEPVHWSSITRA
jgi:hypothetical protein